MNKFKDFIKNKKDLLFGIIYMMSSVYLYGILLGIFTMYNVDTIYKFIILFVIYLIFKFWKKGFELVFSNDKYRE